MKSTKCALRGKIGHWANDCKNEPDERGKQDIAAKVTIPQVLLAVADGTGLESATHQTSSDQASGREKTVPEVELPVHIVSRDPGTGCIQIDSAGERPQVMMD